VQLALTLGFTEATLCLWVTFGFFGTAGILPYAGLSHSFAAALVGRVNTALIGLLLVFQVLAAAWFLFMGSKEIR
jgi:hypothetical protein